MTKQEIKEKVCSPFEYDPVKVSEVPAMKPTNKTSDCDWQLVAMSLIDSILDGINDAWDDMDKWRLNSWGIIKDLNVKTDYRLEEAKQRIAKILSTPEGVRKLNQLNGVYS